MALGLTVGASNSGLLTFFDGTSEYFAGNPLLYGVSVGTTPQVINPWTASKKAVGVTPDPTKSGLIAKFSGLTLGTVSSEKLGNFYIRY